MTTRFGSNRMLACVVDIAGIAVVVAVVVVVLVAAGVVVMLLMVVVVVVVAVVVVVVVDGVVANVGEGIEGGGVVVLDC